MARVIEIDTHELIDMIETIQLSIVAVPMMRDQVVKAGGIEARDFSLPKTPVSDGWMWQRGGIVKRPSGTLLAAMAGGKGSIFHLNSTLHQFSYGVDQRVPYAPSIIADDNVHQGRPYLIKAKNKPFLCFAVSATEMVRKRRVVHPGGIALTGAGTGRALLSRARVYVEGLGPVLVYGASRLLPLFK
jgi:hypothetical protein